MLWGMFSSGVAVHFFASRLAIMDNAFVIPPNVTEERIIVPTKLIAKERRLLALAGLLTGGALDLAFYYLRRPRAP